MRRVRLGCHPYPVYRSPHLFKNCIVAAGLLLAALGLGPCKKSTDIITTGALTQPVYFSGLARSSAATFTLNGVAYAGLGMNGVDSLGAFKDFYTYTPASNSWNKMARFSGKGRYMAVAFAANGTGYVGTGYDGLTRLADFWQYDPAIGAWTGINIFGGAKRLGASAFTINDPATVLTYVLAATTANPHFYHLEVDHSHTVLAGLTKPGQAISSTTTGNRSFVEGPVH